MGRVLAALMLAMSLVALFGAPAAEASSIGGVVFVSQLGARLDRPEAAPAVRVGVVYEATVVSTDKLTRLGIVGASVGDRIRVTVLQGSKASVTLLAPAAQQVAPAAARTSTIAAPRTVTLTYDATGKLSMAH